jgi:hypothetical protein
MRGSLRGATAPRNAAHSLRIGAAGPPGGDLQPLEASGESRHGYSRSPAASRGPIRGLGLGVVLAAELRRLGPTFVPGFLNDRRDLGVGEEALKALLIPVKEHPDPVVLIGIAKDGRTLGAVLLSLLSALG